MVRLGRALAVAAACLPLASALGIKGPKALVQGGQDEQFSSKDASKPLFDTLELGPSDTFKLTFGITDGPALQATAMYSGGFTTVQPLSVKSEGKKATLTIRGADAPAYGENELTILLSSGVETKPVRWKVGKLVFAPKPEKKIDPLLAFVALPDIEHTFQREAKIVMFPFAIAGVAAVLAAWALLLGLIGNLSSSLSKRTPPPSVYVFLGCLVGLEALIICYWVSWKLYQFLPLFLILSGITAYVCAVAMRQSRAQRIQTGGK